MITQILREAAEYSITKHPLVVQIFVNIHGLSIDVRTPGHKHFIKQVTYEEIELVGLLVLRRAIDTCVEELDK